MTVLGVLLGMVVILGLTALTGYFVAQEFGYMTVDRSRLKAAAAAGDRAAERALGITRRTSFMLSGAQLGITVTGLLVGYVAEPLVGTGLGQALGAVGVPDGAGLAVGTLLALLFSTVVQMVYGELFPKNLAIARPDPTARRLAGSTRAYLAVFGWLIKLFDQAANLLLKLVRIEPVHDVEHAATPRDLEHIIAESRDSGQLPADLSALLDRVLDFHDSTAEHAMTPRTRLSVVEAASTVRQGLERVAKDGHTRMPVVGESIDDITGIVHLRDLLAVEEQDLDTTTVGSLARQAVAVPATSRLPSVLIRLRDAGQEMACVLDEYGGFAGVLTVEDIAEELVGEIADEHEPFTEVEIRRERDGSLVVPGDLHIDEVQRLLRAEFPADAYQTIGGLATAHLERLAEPGDRIELELDPDPTDEIPGPRLILTVLEVERHVPHRVRLELEQPAPPWGRTETGPGPGPDDAERGRT